MPVGIRYATRCEVILGTTASEPTYLDQGYWMLARLKRLRLNTLHFSRSYRRQTVDGAPGIANEFCPRSGERSYLLNGIGLRRDRGNSVAFVFGPR